MDSWWALNGRGGGAGRTPYIVVSRANQAVRVGVSQPSDLFVVVESSFRDPPLTHKVGGSECRGCCQPPSPETVCLGWQQHTIIRIIIINPSAHFKRNDADTDLRRVEPAWRWRGGSFQSLRNPGWELGTWRTRCGGTGFTLTWSPRWTCLSTASASSTLSVPPGKSGKIIIIMVNYFYFNPPKTAGGRWNPPPSQRIPCPSGLFCQTGPWNRTGFLPTNFWQAVG